MQALSFKQSFFPSFSALLPDVSFFMKCYITFSFAKAFLKKGKGNELKITLEPKKVASSSAATVVTLLCSTAMQR